MDYVIKYVINSETIFQQINIDLYIEISYKIYHYIFHIPVKNMNYLN